MNDLEQHTDILSLIRVRMSGLSKGHKRIAEYILANYEKCAFLTAAKLGEVVGVSESTAVRFPAVSSCFILLSLFLYFTPFVIFLFFYGCKDR